jgi:hypothetical protein
MPVINAIELAQGSASYVDWRSGVVVPVARLPELPVVSAGVRFDCPVTRIATGGEHHGRADREDR